MAHHEFRVLVGGKKVAQVSGRDFASVEAQAFHYALQYREDGDVAVQKQVSSSAPGGKWYWKRHALFAALTEGAPND